MGTPTGKKIKSKQYISCFIQNVLLNQLIGELIIGNYMQSSETLIKIFDLGIQCKSDSSIPSSSSDFK